MASRRRGRGSRRGQFHFFGHVGGEHVPLPQPERGVLDAQVARRFVERRDAIGGGEDDFQHGDLCQRGLINFNGAGGIALCNTERFFHIEYLTTAQPIERFLQ